ncbi:MAG: nucleotide exchange factor GrpE [Puniceicoccales bacterium]|jgi:molecular chaperone GrpE|nr:nucleotide exchange factor GrpE [Puniceicoccales bacterium]
MTENHESLDKKCNCHRCEEDGACSNGVDVEAQVANLQAQLETQTDLHMRALADLDNFKKRMQKDREEMRTLVTGAIIEDLLPVVDHFELGLQSAENHKATEILAGFTMVFDQLKKILTSYGLNEIVPLNREFDPREHECVRHEYAENLRENTVTCVIRKGYKLNGRLIRPAVVAVSTQQPAEVNG